MTQHSSNNDLWASRFWRFWASLAAYSACWVVAARSLAARWSACLEPRLVLGKSPRGGGLLGIYGVLMLGLGVGWLAFGIGAWTLKPWAWMLGLILGGLASFWR